MTQTQLRAARFGAAILVMAVASAAFGAGESIPRYVIAGGGSSSNGGGYSVAGTVGQTAIKPAPMTGGGYELNGGFWPGNSITCGQPGDLNADGRVDGQDIQLFVDCIISGTGSCMCADFDGGGAGASDIAIFVHALLN